MTDAYPSGSTSVSGKKWRYCKPAVGKNGKIKSDWVRHDRRLFLGPFDERYGVLDDPNHFGQVYGSGVADFEKLSSTARLLSRS